MTKVSLHRFADLPRWFLVALGFGTGIVTIGGFASLMALTKASQPEAAVAVERQFQTFARSLPQSGALWETAVDHLPKIMNVTLYTPTPTCEDYEQAETAIARDEAIPKIVHLLLVEQVPKLINFDFGGYRVQTNPQNNLVKIDFRQPDDALRQFTSLSICERRILFGSLRKTLLSNSELEISEVQFTEQDRPIYP